MPSPPASVYRASPCRHPNPNRNHTGINPNRLPTAALHRRLPHRARTLDSQRTPDSSAAHAFGPRLGQAFATLASALRGLPNVLGFGTMNEPMPGFINWHP
eukprot:scaffold16728_cov40-Phaeocystis_antarctica.AAC.2